MAIDRILSILEAIMKTCDSFLQDGDLPPIFRKVGPWLRLAQRALGAVKIGISAESVSEDSYRAMQGLTGSIKVKAQRLRDIIETVASPPDTSRIARYYTAVRQQGRGSQVEILMGDLLEDICVLAAENAIRGEAKDQVNDLNAAIDELSAMEPSVPEEESDAAFSHLTSNMQPIHVRSGSLNMGSGKQFSGEIVHFGNFGEGS